MSLRNNFDQIFQPYAEYFGTKGNWTSNDLDNINRCNRIYENGEWKNRDNLRA